MSDFIYDDICDFLNLPQEYKGINFYPILICEQQQSKNMYECLGIPKSYFNKDIHILKSSYLKFIILFAGIDENKEKNHIYYSLISLIKHVTRQENVEIIKEFRRGINLNDKDLKITPSDIIVSLRINDVFFNESEFDVVREIILRQSFLNTKYIEDYNQELEDFLGISSKGENSFEDRLFVLSCFLQKLPEEIGELSIYQFNKLYSASIIIERTREIEPLVISKQIKVDKKYKTYNDPLPSIAGRYDSIKMSQSEFMNKLGLGKQKADVDIGSEQNINLPKIPHR